MAMIARNPLSESCQKLTCSWPVPRSNTLTSETSPHSNAGAGVEVEPSRGLRGRAGDKMRGVIAYAAHLRVYQPLGALSEEERRHWSAYVESGTAPSRPMLMALEQQAGVTAALAVPPRAQVTTEEHAYIRHL